MNESLNKGSVLVVTTLGCFLPPFTGAAIVVALPHMGSELDMDAISLGWVITSYFLALVMLGVPFGRLADIYGKKKIFSWGIIVFTVTSLLLTVANSAIMLITLRFLQGVGGAMILSIGVAMLTLAFPASERGRVLGINAAVVYVGFSIGPFLGGLLTQYFGWRSIFLVNVPLGIIVIAFIFWKLKDEWVEARGEKFDIVGAIIYSLVLVAIVYGFTSLPELLGVWLIVVGVVGGVIFIIWEMKAKSPVLEVKLFRGNRTFIFSCFAALINYGATAAVAFLLSLYLQYIKGFSPQNAGFVLVSQPIVQAMFSPLAGRISDRIQPRIVASAGMACTLIGLLPLVFLSEETHLLLIIASLLLLGFGLALFVSPNTNAIMSSVEKKFYGVASATLSTMRQIGIILSMAIVMLLFALYMGRVQITPEYYGAFLQSVKVAFVISAILCFFGIFASLARGKIGEARRQNS